MSRRIFVAGHNGMVGSSLVRQLTKHSDVTIVTRSHKELDLKDQAAVRELFSTEVIHEVYLAAAKVGGIHANNTYPAEFIYENLMMECNIIHQAYSSGIKKLLLLGSSCIYPKLAEQPIKEEALLTGKLEPTNEPYAIAKIAGIKLCESYNRQYDVDYRSVMPTNLYGPNDNFHPENSHVIPAMINRFHEAKINNKPEVIVWGTGTPKREFLHVDDMASASIYLMNLDKGEYRKHTTEMLSHINVGTGLDCSIADVATMISDVVGFKGYIKFDTTKPDGTPRKLLDVSRLNQLGWQAKILLEDGLETTYHWYLEHYEKTRKS